MCKQQLNWWLSATYLITHHPLSITNGYYPIFYYNLHNTLNFFDIDIDDMYGPQKISKNNLPNGY